MVTCNSSMDPALSDQDSLKIIIGFPADFSGLGELGVAVLILMAVLVYMKFVRKD